MAVDPDSGGYATINFGARRRPGGLDDPPNWRSIDTHQLIDTRPGLTTHRPNVHPGNRLNFPEADAEDGGRRGRVGWK